jgi:hypothetical protein
VLEEGKAFLQHPISLFPPGEGFLITLDDRTTLNNSKVALDTERMFVLLLAHMSE